MTDPESRARTRSIGDLFRTLSADLKQLLRQEIALAKAEVGAAAKKTAREVGVVGLAGVIVGVGALVLAAALVLGLGAVIGSYWLAALISGAVLAAAGAMLSLRGLGLVNRGSLAPSAAIAELEATGRWAGDEVADFKAALTREAQAEPAEFRAPVTRVLPEPLRLPLAAPVHVEVRERPARTARAPAPPTPAPERTSGEGLLTRVKREVVEDNVLGHAAQLAFYAFLAMPPALMAIFGAAGLIGSERIATWLQEQAALAMPQAVLEGIIRPFIQDVVLSKAPGPFSIGLLLALWGASSVFAGLMDALNAAFDVEEGRSWLKKRALALATMIGSVILFLLAAVALLAGPSIAAALGVGGAGRMVWNLVQWPLAFAFMVAAFWLGYYILPHRDQSRCKLVLAKAAAIAALAWVAATAAFRLYIANFSSYSETYGFLGAFIILLLWLYLTAIVVLLGGVLAAEMER